MRNLYYHGKHISFPFSIGFSFIDMDMDTLGTGFQAQGVVTLFINNIISIR